SFAMDDFRSLNNRSPKSLSKALMTETNAQNRQALIKMINQRQRNPRILWAFGAGRNHQVFRCEFLNVCNRNLIIFKGNHMLAKAGKILDQIVSKRIVIIYNNQH